jgi:hypothetical protein
VNTGLPVVGGVLQVGQLLTAGVGSWSNGPTGYGYQWRRCDAAGNGCVDLVGATAGSYTLVAADLNATVRVRVTASNAGGSASAESAASGLVAAAAVTNLAPNPDLELSPGPYYGSNGDGVFSWATDAARSGTHSLKIVSSSGSLSRWFTLTSLIPAQAGKSYFVGAWLRTQGGQANLSVNFWNGGTHLATISSGSLSGVQPFTQLTLQLVAPAGTTALRVEYRINGPGTLWADDLVVVSGTAP